MKTIQTKFLPVTERRGSRIKAYDTDGFSVTIPYPHELSGLDCHWEAVKAFMVKYEWSWPGKKMAAGHTKNGAIFVYIGDTYTCE